MSEAGSGRRDGASVEGDVVRFHVDDDHVAVAMPDGTSARLAVSVTDLASGDLASADPPPPDALANALGTVSDHVDDLVLAHPDLPDHLASSRVVMAGPVPLVVARVEIGRDDVPMGFELTRDAAEDVFRTLATERASDRAHNPGLPADRVGSVVAGCCVLLGIMRRLGLRTVAIEVPA